MGQIASTESKIITCQPVEYYIVLAIVILGVFNILAIRLRAFGHWIHTNTVASGVLGIIQSALLLVVLIPFLYRYPPTKYIYAVGGIPALISSFLTTAFASCLILLNLLYFKDFGFMTSEERNYELSTFLLTILVLLGSLVFSNLEGWNFEKASEFCMMTLLTIGYGDIVPKTSTGKLLMVIYTMFGLDVLLAIF